MWSATGLLGKVNSEMPRTLARDSIASLRLDSSADAECNKEDLLSRTCSDCDPVLLLPQGLRILILTHAPLLPGLFSTDLFKFCLKSCKHIPALPNISTLASICNSSIWGEKGIRSSEFHTIKITKRLNNGWWCLLQAEDSLTALRFDETGLMCAVGTSSGLVALFDLRSSKPLTVKDHMYSSPIVDPQIQGVWRQLRQAIVTMIPYVIEMSNT